MMWQNVINAKTKLITEVRKKFYKNKLLHKKNKKEIMKINNLFLIKKFLRKLKNK